MKAHLGKRERSPCDGLPAAKVVKFSPEEKPDTIYEMANSDLLVVYKPPHWTATTSKTAGGPTVHGKQKIQDWLQDVHGGRFPFLEQDGENGTQNYSNGIAQRLDVETSGPFIVATNLTTWKKMKPIISKKENMRKEYVALMHGTLPFAFQSGVLKYPLKTTNSPKGSRTEVHERGDSAETQYDTIKLFSWGTSCYTLLRLRIITGRTHQIRVHVKELAREAGLELCGLVGDYKYLPREQVTEDKKFCNRVFLHASLLQFLPPGQQQPVRIECDLPVELTDVLDKLTCDKVMTV